MVPSEGFSEDLRARSPGFKCCRILLAAHRDRWGSTFQTAQTEYTSGRMEAPPFLEKLLMRQSDLRMEKQELDTREMGSDDRLSERKRDWANCHDLRGTRLAKRTLSQHLPAAET